jgi:hypothetical protein
MTRDAICHYKAAMALSFKYSDLKSTSYYKSHSTPGSPIGGIGRLLFTSGIMAWDVECVQNFNDYNLKKADQFGEGWPVYEYSILATASSSSSRNGIIKKAKRLVYDTT